MCSTFKLPLAAAALARVDAGSWQATDALLLREADIVGYAPITRPRVKEGPHEPHRPGPGRADPQRQRRRQPLAAPPGRAGGLHGLAADAGDASTRIDRMEPEMNHVVQGDLRDTTTPAAMAALTARLALGDALQPASRERLVGWMRATETGLRRPRAGLPATGTVATRLAPACRPACRTG